MVRFLETFVLFSPRFRSINKRLVDERDLNQGTRVSVTIRATSIQSEFDANGSYFILGPRTITIARSFTTPNHSKTRFNPVRLFQFSTSVIVRMSRFFVSFYIIYFDLMSSEPEEDEDGSNPYDQDHGMDSGRNRRRRTR